MEQPIPLTNHYAMIVTFERGKHRGPGGDYVFSAAGILVRLDKPDVAVARESAYGDDAVEARAILRDNLLLVARQKEEKINVDKKDEPPGEQAMTSPRRYSYLLEKLQQARRILMAPHPRGEEQAFVDAFGVLSRRNKTDDDGLEGDAHTWIRTIVDTMDTTGLTDPGVRGLFAVRVVGLSFDDKARFSTAVDELAHYLASSDRARE